MATGILNGHLHMLRTLVDQAHASVSTALNTSGPAVALLKPQDVAELIREVLRNATKDFGVGFEVKPDPPDRPWIINCDADRLREVFRELTVNARKATAGSGMATHITVTLQPWMHEGAELGVHIAFADNGPGFLPEYREHAFERFYRKFKEGYGLGLFLCNRLIEAHQGIIQVRDQTPGATFDIYLPTNSET
jgi:signal transduction histidine kinase